MIRRSPAEYYIKYLLLLPDSMSDEDIIRTLRELQLDFPGSRYLTRLRASLKPPKPFYPMVETDLPSYKFLQKHKVQRLFFPDQNVSAALQLLEQPKAKEVIESMVLVEESMFNICSRLRKFGFIVAPKAVEYYRHFFFNTSLVDPTEMRALISVRVDDMLMDGEDKETLIRHKAMKQAMYVDPRFMAVNSPTPQLGALRLQMRHGLRSTRLDHIRLAEGIRTASLIAMHDSLMRGGPKSAAEARDYSVVFATMDKVLTEGNAQGTVQKDLLALGTDMSEIPSIKQLTDGNYTDSVDLVQGVADVKR